MPSMPSRPPAPPSTGCTRPVRRRAYGNASERSNRPQEPTTPQRKAKIPNTAPADSENILIDSNDVFIEHQIRSFSQNRLGLSWLVKRVPSRKITRHGVAPRIPSVHEKEPVRVLDKER